MKLALKSAGLVVVLSVLSPGAALAEEATASKAEDPAAGLRGFEVTLRPAFGGAPSGSPVVYEPQPDARLSADPGALLRGATPYAPGFVGQAQVGYRFIPFVSAGLRGGIRTVSADVVDAATRDLTRSAWDAGLYVRAYPLAGAPKIARYVDPWIGTGVAYMRDVQSYKTQVAAEGRSFDFDVTIDHHAVAIPISIGADYRVTRFLSIGPSFEYAFANQVAGCFKASSATPGVSGSTHCSTEAPADKYIRAKSYGVWSAGLSARATF